MGLVLYILNLRFFDIFEWGEMLQRRDVMSLEFRKLIQVEGRVYFFFG